MILNIRHDPGKLLEENTGKTFSDINHTSGFFGQSPKATEIKTKINKGGLIKLTSFCTAKKTINKIKRQSTGWEKYLQICDQEGFNFQNIQTAHTTQKKKKPNNPIEKRAEERNRHTSKQEIHRHQQHRPSGFWPDCKVQLRPVHIPRPVL